MSSDIDWLHAEEMIEAATLLEAEAYQVETDPEPWPSLRTESLLMSAHSTRHVAALLRVAAAHFPERSETGDPSRCTACALSGAEESACDVWNGGRDLAFSVLEGYA